MAKDYYQTLGVAKDASNQDIKRAYRKLAKQYHPDVNKEASADQRFKDIQEAFDVLGDEENERSMIDTAVTSIRWQALELVALEITKICSDSSEVVDGHDLDNRSDLKICSVRSLVRKKCRPMKSLN